MKLYQVDKQEKRDWEVYKNYGLGYRVSRRAAEATFTTFSKVLIDKDKGFRNLSWKEVLCDELWELGTSTSKCIRAMPRY